GVDEDAHEGPDAGGEVDGGRGIRARGIRCDYPAAWGAGNYDRGAAGRPGRDQAFVAENLAVARSAAELPVQLAFSGIDAIEIAVVGAEIDAASPGDRGETDRAVGEEAPFLRAGGNVQSADAIVPGGIEEER